MKVVSVIIQKYRVSVLEIRLGFFVPLAAVFVGQ